MTRRKRGRGGSVTVADVDDELAGNRVRHARLDLRIKRFIGYGAPLLLAAQLAATDIAFFIYGDTQKWEIPSSAIQVWLAATVVQLFVILRAVTKYVFPPGAAPEGTAAAPTPAVTATTPLPVSEETAQG